MAQIEAFRALRFAPEAGVIDELVCPPYDIISEEERAAFLEQNPHNIIRLELPREGADPYADAGQTLRAWRDEGILVQDERPGLYVYEERFEVGGRPMRVKGLVCRVRLEEFEKGVVLPHEETLSKAKTDRFNLMCATGCNFSSIYSLYFDGDNAIYPRIEAASAGEPLLRFFGGDGVEHLVWKCEDAGEIAAVRAAFADKKLYIADGHHRYETALNYRNHLVAGGEAVGEDHPANFVMMTLVHMEHPGLVVFPTHRVVRGLDGFSAERLVEGCREHFEVTEIPAAGMEDVITAAAQSGRKALALYTGERALCLTLKGEWVDEGLLPGMSAAYRALDVSLLHTLILERILGIDKANMMNQVNLTYTRDAAEAMGLVDDGRANCAFLLNPTGVEEIAAVAGAGEKMPQKSTYFYPKLITGHMINPIG